MCKPTHDCVKILTWYNKYYCTGVETIMSHYTLSWHDQQTKYQICEYANDAFEAVRNAREDVPYLHEHPFSLESIKKEE